ncbi:hypothetical protein [Rodentibacter heidelbergensis]|uniref:Uncharacterized protein n=1 Tax=Rodentibacter heidelbergensis TaxID=1908258 RepID=A0A1V3IB38_9PAST|nr:hypothetical protein [Rodentibacter heidelbergensis]OOF37375.1 hypothetical protein BKK48_02065 [Rodentibacter heidelbergensis]
MNEYLKHRGAPVLARLEGLLKFALKSLQKACGRGEGLLAIFRKGKSFKNQGEIRLFSIVGLVFLI